MLVGSVEDLPLATKLRLNVVPAVAQDAFADTRGRAAVVALRTSV